MYEERNALFKNTWQFLEYGGIRSFVKEFRTTRSSIFKKRKSIDGTFRAFRGSNPSGCVKEMAGNVSMRLLQGVRLQNRAGDGDEW
jgi:hypothetical protein